MNPKHLIGKEVEAIGDCGMTKDVALKGILKYNDSLQYYYINNSSINENTIKVL